MSNVGVAIASRRRRTALMLSGAVLALVTANPAMGQAADALPTGGTVVAGSATIGTPSSAKLDIVQSSNRAVIEWTSFDIGQSAEVAFAQPSASAIALNRVTGGTAPSQIAGKLTANGIVAVLNANGVLFAGTADIDVGGLIVSTGQIDTTAFMAGGNVLGVTGASGGEIVVSAGADITVANAGLAAFVAPSVRNSGTITATAGRVQLGAGTAFTLDLASDGLLQIGIGADSPLVQNLGGVFAAGGQIQLSARQASALLDQTIRTGVLPAGTARLDGSTIVLDATNSNVELTSEIAGRGNLTLSGSRIFGAADVNVDGSLTLNVNAGGAVADTLVGGNNWINDALGVIGAQVDATTINLGAGLYRPGTVINASNVTLDGQGVGRIGWVSGIENAIDVWGDNVTVRNLEIFGPATSAYTSFAWGSTNSRGVFVNRFADNVTVTNNNIHDIRTGIIVDGRNLNAVITGNRLDNTKSGISVQYTNGGDALTSGLAGSSITLAGNFEGAIGNEWGINVHLNGIWNGDAGNPGPSTSLVGGIPVGILGTASLTEQQRLVALGAANNGMSVQNLAYSAANRTRAYVAPGGGTVTQGSRLSPLASVQAGVNAVVAGGTVFVLPGEYSEGVTGVGQFGGSGGNSFGLHVTKDSVTIRGVDQNWQPITSAENVAAYVRSLYQAGFGAQHFVTGSNVTIEGLGFRPATAGNNKTLEVVGNNFTLRNSVVDNTGNATAANFYISDFEEPGTPRVESFTLTGNIFLGGTTSSAMVVVGGGVGRTTSAANRVFANNQLFGNNLAGRRGFQIQGRIPSTAWQQLLSGAATVTGNVFTGVDIPVRTTGILTAPLAWDDIFRNNGNVFAGGAAMAYKGNTGEARGVLVVDGSESYEDIRITRTIQASIDRTLTGDTVRMLDGTYNIGNSPILIRRGLSLIGASQAGVIIDGRGVGAGLGTMQVQADNVTLSNFTLYGADSGVNNYGIKVQPNSSGGAYSPNQRLLNFAISDVTVRGSTRAELDLNGVVGATITNFTADGRRVTNDAFQSGGAGVQITDSSNITLTGVHTLGNAWGGVALYQANKSNAYNGQTTNINIDAAANQFDEANGLFSQLESTTQGFGQLNLTGFNYAVRNTDHRPDDLDAQFIFYRISLTDAVAFAQSVGTASASSIEGYTGTALSNVFTVANGMSINSAIRDARSGGTVNIADGIYNLGTSAIVITKSLNLLGQSQAGVIIDGRGVNNSEGRGTISVLADNTTLANFTLYGSEQANGNFGIKVQPTNVGHESTPGGDDRQLVNFAVSDVTVRGSRRAELDLNGVVGATITNFTADGRRVADNAATAGAGIQITDSADVTLTGVHTVGNTWGSVALYQSNKASGFNIQTNNVNINAAANQFEESIGVFSQLESTTQGFGQLNLTGFNYAIRNTDHRPDNLDGQFIFYRTSLTDAVAFAKVVGTASASSIEGYTGTAFSNVFTVADGLSINSAIRDVRAGGAVNVGIGTFAETVSIDKALTFAGAGMNATSITGGMLLSGSLNNLVLRDFTVSGSGGSSVIGNSATINGLTVDGVRIDGLNVANRHGFTGGQIGGDISITDSEFVNIRGWSAFDTRSGTSGDNGSQITSGVFSNNLLDNTVGHIAFRQQIGAATLPNIVISGNTVRNVGSAANSFGAAFKAFNANTVDFTGNNVSGVGTSGFNPAGEAAYGAVLMTRGTAVLNVTDNTFANNNQVFAVEPGRALPGVTNFSGNSFVNNGYSIYLPANLSGAGTIQFGAGNDFTAGANTVQHVLWRSASGLDLTGVSFDGTLASELSLGEAFAVEDLITHGVDLAGFGLASLIDGELFVTTGSGTDAALRAVALGTNGDTLNLSAGTHTLTDTLFLSQDIDVLGQGIGATILDASGHGNWGIRVHADDVSLGGFTLNGSPAVTSSSYGIKVEAGGGVSDRNTGFAITNVAIAGSRKHGLDLNAVVGAVIDGVSVTGVTAGNGISISDSANVIVRNSSTAGNAWGGLALYQTNNLAGGGSDQQLTGITVEASNAFGEPAGVYLQDSSTLTDPGTLAVLGYGYTVRNADHRPDGAQFTFFQKTAQNAFDYAVGLASPGSSVVQGWVGSANDRNFHVGFGSLAGGGQQALSLQAAFGASVNGDTINVASGTYAQSATLAGTRVLNFGNVTLNGLTLAAATAGNSLKGNLTLANGGFTAAGPLALTGATSIAAISGNISLGAVTGAQALSLSGNAVTLGAANIASLTATGASIATAGVITTGTQTYTGPVSLAGSYGASSFAVTGATTLNGATTIAASGNIALGSIGGAQALTLNGNAVALGAANIASLSAIGSSIATSGVTTTGAQSYTGPVTLAGSYGAASFTVNGATTLGGATTIAASSNIALGAIGGAHALALNGTGITLGTATLASLTATGTSIATSGVTTTGAQSYTGPVTLNGGYGASSFAVAGATTLGSATTIAASGNIGLGTVGGVQALTLSGNAVTLGAANLGSLAATGTSIATSGVTTTGSQSYTGPVTLSGSYGASSFSVTGATTLGGATSVAASGSIGLGTIGGANALTLSGTGITLGAANLASLAATGTSIATGGVTTSGAQSYTGPVTLAGAYSASSFAVTGAATLGAATTIAASGTLGLGTVGGAQALTLNGGAVTLGATNIASLAATGASIATSGVTTTGAQSYVGPVTLAGTYGAASFAVTGATTLAAATTIAANGNVELGAVAGARALTLSGAGVTLGAANLASLAVTGTSIATAGITTTGAQSYTGPVTLKGGYGASSFTVTGAATLGAATTIAATGAIGLGAVGGGQALTLNGAGITLGTANLASLAVTGTGITTAGVTTTGAQSYTGPTALAGSYNASSFTVNGAATLGGATAIAANGNLTLGIVSGAQALNLSGGGVTLGAANLASLVATGTSIATAGVSTSGAQSYTGPVTLAGSYSAVNFTVAGATTLAGATTIAASGNLTLGTVAGAQALTLSGSAVSLGAANLANLAATGASIATNGVVTSGAQSYTGPVTLNGSYGASTLTVNGATMLSGATSIAATGAIGLGTVSGAQGLTVSGAGITLGAADLGSLAATGSIIVTGGVVTTGTQAYLGETVLSGDYQAASFIVDGATTLAGGTSVSADGDIALDTVEGDHALALSGEGIALGAANLASLAATGTSIATSGVTTTGAQSYVGATTLAGGYDATGFSVDGAVTLGADTQVIASGAATFESIDGAQNFALTAGSAVLGAVGQDIRIAELTVTADETVLTAGTYRADSMSLAGEDGATVRLTQVETIFDSTPAGGPIAIASHLIGTEPGKQNVTFVTGTGAAGDGDIALGNVGTNAVRIGDLTVTGGDFSAATVKLAGDFSSVLGGSQVFSAQTLDTLGNVKAQVAGSESGPIVAGGAVSVTAGGSGTGSIVAGGPVELAYSNEVSREISSQSSVSLAATGAVTGSITATGSVAVSSDGLISTTVNTDNDATLASVAGVSSNVTAGGDVQLSASQGTVSSQVTSGGAVNVDATGAVTGSISATGPVAVNADGLISTTVNTDNGATIASVAGISSNVTAGGGVQLTASQGTVSSQVSSGGAVSVNATGAVTGSISATGSVAVSASGPVSTAVNTGNNVNITSATGISSAVTAGGAVQVSATQGAVTGSINAGGAVAVTAQGPVSTVVTTTGAANVVSTSGGVSSTINAGGPVAVEAPGPVTSTITTGGTVQLTSNAPIDVQVTGGAVSVNAPGGQVSGVFGEITTDEGGTFVVNDQPVVGDGMSDARQIIVDSFLAPVGGTVGAAGEPQLPNGLALALIAPSGAAGQRAVVVGSVDSLGDLLRQGYTAIIIDVGESGLEPEPENAGS